MRVGIRLDDGEVEKYSLLLSQIDISEFKTGEEITGIEYAKIKELDERYRAIRFALNLLSHASHSAKALYLKLIRRGIGHENCESAVKYAISLGYINEERDLRSSISVLANTHLYGERKIVEKLLLRHYKRDKIVALIRAMSSEGEIDLEKNARLLVEKKLYEDSSEEEIEALLYKYGYKIRDYEDD